MRDLLDYFEVFLVLGTESEESLVLVLSVIGELVGTNSGSVRLESADLSHVLSEDIHSEVELLGGSVVFAKLRNVLGKLQEVGVEKGGGGVSSEGRGDNEFHSESRLFIID